MPSPALFQVSRIAPLLIAVVRVGLASCPVAAAPPPPATAAIPGRDAMSPVAPIVPGEVVAHLQEGKFDAARTALIELRGKAKDRTERAYLGLLQGIAEQHSGRKDDARATLRAAIAEDPAGPWLPKLSFELATVELAAGNLAAAEELTRAEATRLLAADRKDGLAEVYHALAEASARPRRSGDPARSECRVGSAFPGARPGQEPDAPGSPALLDGPGQPEGGQRAQGDRELPVVSPTSIPGAPIAWRRSSISARPSARQASSRRPG